MCDGRLSFLAYLFVNGGEVNIRAPRDGFFEAFPCFLRVAILAQQKAARGTGVNKVRLH